MVQRIGGSRRKSRHKLLKNYRDKGKTALRKHLQEFRKGEKVVLDAEPSVQSGMYNLRFHGHVAEIQGKEGSCYKVSLKDRTKAKTFIVHPVHLKKVKA